MNRHETPLLPSSSLTSDSPNREHGSLPADKQVDPLYEIIIVGSDLCPENFQKTKETSLQAGPGLSLDGQHQW